jgi:hypothetical protein
MILILILTVSAIDAACAEWSASRTELRLRAPRAA